MTEDEDGKRHDIETLTNELSFSNGCPPWSLLDSRKRADAWELMWHDLRTKAADFPVKERLDILTEGLLQRLVADGYVESGQLVNQLHGYLKGVKPKYGAIVFTALKTEFESMCIALEVSSETSRKITDQHYLFKVVNIPGSPSTGFLPICIVLCGRQRNIPMALCVLALLETVETDLCILMGIAAGNHKEVRLGDVVIARQVLDYEGGSVKASHLQTYLSDWLKGIFGGWRQHDPEVTFFDVPDSVGVPSFSPADRDWLHLRDKCLEKIEEAGKIVPLDAGSKPPKCVTGMICSGEKVRRDGYVSELANRFHRKIYALDMEASGFAAACKSKNMDWAVFRGVSDFGDGKKNDDWQAVSALHAALVVRAFLSAMLPTNEGSKSDNVELPQAAF